MNTLASPGCLSACLSVRRASAIAGVAVLAVLTGCASTGPSGAASRASHPADPWEGMNRKIYQFNDEFDRGITRPIAEFYTFITPAPARSCVRNIFGNLGDVWSAFNSLLQGRGHDFVNTLGRVLLNTTMGVGGCFDVHTANNGTRIRNDFGTTLGVWGIGQGPYLVLPVLGPSSIRDGVGLATDVFVNPLTAGAIHDVPVRNSVIAVQAVNTRANLLGASDLVDNTALDAYSFVRDAWLQRRNSMVWQRTGQAQALPDYGDNDEDDDGDGHDDHDHDDDEHDHDGDDHDHD